MHPQSVLAGHVEIHPSRINTQGNCSRCHSQGQRIIVLVQPLIARRRMIGSVVELCNKTAQEDDAAKNGKAESPLVRIIEKHLAEGQGHPYSAATRALPAQGI